MGQAYEGAPDGKTDSRRFQGVYTSPQSGESITRTYDWVVWRRCSGLAIANAPSGHTVRKKDMALQLGYEGKKGWEKNKPQIMRLVGDFYEEMPDNVQKLRRRGPPLTDSLG